MNVYFYILIFITGILTIYTDTLKRKIKNLHLLIVCSLAIIGYAIFIALGQLNVSISLILNPFIALFLGFIFYKVNLWKAGDAKLFFIYSLLLPQNKYSSILPFSCFVLFFNTFLMSFLFILPFFLKDIIVNKDKIIKEVVSQKTFVYFGKIFLITFGISWIIRPILNFFSLKNNIFLNFILLYAGYSVIYKIIDKVENKFIVISIFIIGFILRYIFMPRAFSLSSILNYLKYLLGYSTTFYILRNIMKMGEAKQQRIPFAPFLFLGAIIYHTNFLWGVIKTLSYLR